MNIYDLLDWLLTIELMQMITFSTLISDCVCDHYCDKWSSEATDLSSKNHTSVAEVAKTTRIHRSSVKFSLHGDYNVVVSLKPVGWGGDLTLTNHFRGCSLLMHQWMGVLTVCVSEGGSGIFFVTHGYTNHSQSQSDIWVWIDQPDHTNMSQSCPAALV